MPQTPKGEKRPGAVFLVLQRVSSAAIFGYCASDVRAMLADRVFFFLAAAFNLRR